ncbi:MAG TPA: transketolase family protein [Clostridiales bacterium]|jgi:transketolase|nr:transketolase family protein [Clostridiales bacterium]
MNKMNMRNAYGEALVELGHEKKNVVALEADLGKSTMSHLFGSEFPDRYFQMGIAEANMISAAAGLALTGHVPFASSFAVFASGRPYDQIRSSVAIPRLSVKICGSSAGLSDFGDGKTHQSVDDIALMRVLPNMKVFSPADYYETKKIVKAIADLEGPCYIRLNRNAVPLATEVNAPFEFGKATQLRDGSDAVVFATGYMVYQALEAAKTLEADGISIRVINLHTIKPLDIEGVQAAAKGMKGAVTVEEASVIGGMGSAVCEALAEGPAESRIKVLRMGIQDCFGTSAQTYEELLTAYHLMPQDIVERVKEAIV